jgi:S1-C subfamily serine protease
MRWFKDFALVGCTLLAVTVLAIAPGISFAYAWDLATMNRQIDQTNFKVNDGCSGTLVDASKGLILTAYHCIEGQYETYERETVAEDGTIKKEKVRRQKEGEVHQLVFGSGADAAVAVGQVSYHFKIEKSDRDNDLALLQVKMKLPNTAAAVIACETPVRGADVFIVGNPTGRLYSSVTKGIVSSTQRTYDTLPAGDSGQAKLSLVQVSGGVVGGNSGGAVYNDRGQLVAVPVLGHRVNEVLAFAVPLGVVRKFLDGKVETPCGDKK